MSSKFQPFKDAVISNFKIKPVVQDIDLIRMDEDNIKQLIEVKKSTFDNWRPFIKRNWPKFGYDRLDDFNYQALYALGEKLDVEVWIFHYVQDKLVNGGINCYKIKNDNLDMSGPKNYSLEDFREKVTGSKTNMCSKRYNNKVKDFDNPNITANQNNLFHFFQTDENIRASYYVEYDGVWTMLISNPVTYQPLWLYIEIDIESSGLDLNHIQLADEFFPQIEIHEKTGVPLSIIAYNSGLTEFTIYQYSNGNFVKKLMSSKEAIDFYGSYIQLLN